jgi:hypothetical protein
VRPVDVLGLGSRGGHLLARRLVLLAPPHRPRLAQACRVEVAHCRPLAGPEGAGALPLGEPARRCDGTVSVLSNLAVPNHYCPESVDRGTPQTIDAAPSKF